MKLTALGTADAFNAAGRGHTAWLLEDELGLCAVDFGPTALAAMKRLGRDPRELRALCFTHLHGDHIGGWPFLLVDALYRARRAEPLAVAGPPGTAARLQALWEASYADTAKKPLGFPLEVKELSPGDEALVAGRSVRAFAALHMTPPHVALMLRVGAAAFTGDTGAQDLGALCAGARVLCAECSALHDAGPKHLSWRELKPLLPRLPVLLAHLGDDVRAAAAALEAEARALGHDVTICDDGRVVSLDT